MSSSPRLFDLAPRLPTTREVAARVKAGGTAALTESERRADSARYVEIACRSALNRVRGMPFEWTLNPYRGCTHGCHYCFARRYHTQFEMNTGDEFASVILVKTNVVSVLAREVDRPAWRRELVALGTATDPYQPIEGRYRLTRGALEILARARTPVGLVTKGPMVVRDIDVLLALSRVAACTVFMSVPTVDEEAWAQLEPGTAHPMQRLRAVSELAAAGVNVGVLMAPVVPGFSSAPAKLERTVRAIADHGARFLGCNVMYLQDGTRAHFMDMLSRDFPALVPRYQRLYRAKYPPDSYRRQVTGMVRLLQDRYGPWPGRAAGPAAENDADEPGEVAQPEQAGFRW